MRAALSQRILIFGATQGVGQALIPALAGLSDQSPLSLHAVTRQAALTRSDQSNTPVTWHHLDLSQAQPEIEADVLISLGPIQYAHDYIQNTPNPPKVVWALSSASTDFKSESSDLKEQQQMADILAAEQALMDVCQARQVQWQLLKTTLLYGRNDYNVNRLAQLIQKLRWVPVLGEGKRAPVHVDDVAQLIVLGLKRYLEQDQFHTGGYRLQGGEILSYPEMLRRIAKRRGLACRVLKLPAAALIAPLYLAHAFGLLQDVSLAMLARQSMDLLVDDAKARQQLGWAPRHFEP